MVLVTAPKYRELETISKHGNEKKGKFSFKRWVKGVFKKQPKEIIPTYKPVNYSVTTIFRNKIKKSKINVRDIDLIDGWHARQLKEKFSVTGSRAMVLEKMVADYNRGRLSLPGLSHTSKFDAKSLDKTRLNRMIKEYDETTREKNMKEAKENVEIMKKKFKMSDRDAKRFEKVLADLHKGKGSHVELVIDLLDPKKLTKQRIQKFIKRYGEGEKKQRGLSYMMTKSNLSFVASKCKVSNFKEDLENLKVLSELLKKYE